MTHKNATEQLRNMQIDKEKLSLNAPIEVPVTKTLEEIKKEAAWEDDFLQLEHQYGVFDINGYLTEKGKDFISNLIEAGYTAGVEAENRACAEEMTSSDTVHAILTGTFLNGYMQGELKKKINDSVLEKAKEELSTTIKQRREND